MTSGFPYPLSHLERFEGADTTADLIGHLIGPHGFDEPVKDASWSSLTTKGDAPMPSTSERLEKPVTVAYRANAKYPRMGDRWLCPHEANNVFCEEHNSWLCSTGQGRCQLEVFCPKAGPYPDEGREEAVADDDG